jgi:hypothetical protein
LHVPLATLTLKVATADQQLRLPSPHGIVIMNLDR